MRHSAVRWLYWDLSEVLHLQRIYGAFLIFIRSENLTRNDIFGISCCEGSFVFEVYRHVTWNEPTREGAGGGTSDLNVCTPWCGGVPAYGVCTY